MKKISTTQKLANVLFPFLVYEIVLSCIMVIVRSFIGLDDSSFMLCQIIGTALTLPVLYAFFYRYDQSVGITSKLTDEIKEKGKLVPAIGLLAALSCALIGTALNNIITMSPLVEASQGFAKANDSFFGSTMTIELIASALLTPLLEELVFRGIIYTRLKMYVGKRIYLAIIGAGLMFAMVHLNIVQFVYALAMGIILCFIMEKAGHMYATFIGHAVANAIAIIRTETGVLSGTADKSPFAWGISVILLIAGLFILTILSKLKKTPSSIERGNKASHNSDTI